MDTNFDTTSLAGHDLWTDADRQSLDNSAAAERETGPIDSPQTAPAPVDLARLAAPSSLPLETRALWVTRWDFRTADDIRRLADNAADANFNALFLQVRGNADAFYRSPLEPWAARLSGGELGDDPGWDPLALAVDEAHARGLEVHTWLNVYPAWLGETLPSAAQPEPMVSKFNRLHGDQWVVWDRHQQPMELNNHYLWSNPGHQAVLEHITAVGQDMVARYYVDGLHLDYVRYPGWEYSRDPLTLAAVAETGLDRKEWQRRQVNQLVAQLYNSIQRLKPGLTLSAAVWPVYLETWEWWDAGDGYDGFCQDSVGWVQEGIADLICPMFYLASITTDDAQYQALLEDFVARAGKEHVVAGIIANYDSFETIARRIDIARAAGAAGQSIFSYSHVNQRDYWSAFKAGPYATPARILLPEPSRRRVGEMLQARR